MKKEGEKIENNRLEMRELVRRMREDAVKENKEKVLCFCMYVCVCECMLRVCMCVCVRVCVCMNVCVYA
jgi:hypothetical protein